MVARLRARKSGPSVVLVVVLLIRASDEIDTFSGTGNATQDYQGDGEIGIRPSFLIQPIPCKISYERAPNHDEG